jgi:hypothetical protein
VGEEFRAGLLVNAILVVALFFFGYVGIREILDIAAAAI